MVPSDEHLSLNESNKKKNEEEERREINMTMVVGGLSIA